MTEARHLQRIGYAAAGLLGQSLQVGGGVVVRHQQCVLLAQQLLDARDQILAFTGLKHFLDDRRNLGHGVGGRYGGVRQH